MTLPANPVPASATFDDPIEQFVLSVHPDDVLPIGSTVSHSDKAFETDGTIILTGASPQTRGVIVSALNMAEPVEPILGYFPEAELVIAVVCPLGTERTGLEGALKSYLSEFGYETNLIRLSGLFSDLFQKLGEKWKAPEEPTPLAYYKIGAGNKIRELTGMDDILAQVAAGLVHDRRADEWGCPLG